MVEALPIMIVDGWLCLNDQDADIIPSLRGAKRRGNPDQRNQNYLRVQPGGLVALMRRPSFTNSFTAPVMGADSPA